MALTIQWRGGDGVDVLSDVQYCGFFGENFGDSIATGAYQDTTCITDISGSVNYAELPNVKYAGASNYGDWGDGAELITGILPTECTLQITLQSGSAFRLHATKFFVYDGTDESVAPPNVIVKAFEQGNTSWQTLSGSGQPLNLTPRMSASTTHTYYVAVTASPQVAGTNAQMRFGVYTEYY